jgi:HEAT repeat protein
LAEVEEFYAEMAAAGFPFTDMINLANSKLRYDAAVPILIRWLPIAPRSDRDGIARALGKPWAKEALDPLIAQFQAEPFIGIDDVRWVIGDSIYVLWTDKRFDELAALATDRSYGYARNRILEGFGKSRRPEAVDVVISQLDDERVLYQGILALRRLGGDKAKAALTRLTDDPRKWVRLDATRALEKIARREHKQAQRTAQPQTSHKTPTKPKPGLWQRLKQSRKPPDTQT